MSFDATKPFLPTELPAPIDPFNKSFVKWLLKARTELGELKGYALSLPNYRLLLNPAILRESVASSGIENINTTVERVLQQQLFPEKEQRIENKEVIRYKDALLTGLESMKQVPVGNRLILKIHKALLVNESHGYRKTQNRIENSVTGKVIYTPPPASAIAGLISNWEKYLHNTKDESDPLIKCIVGHYQFEAIHPFADGNGRTGRILMVLYLIEQGLMDHPILYISGYINKNRSEYYRLLNEVSSKNNWNPYIEFMLKGFYFQARGTKEMLLKIISLLAEIKEKIKTQSPSVYSGELIDQLFAFPVITPVRLASALGIHYTTATRHLKQLQKEGILSHQTLGKYQLYINHQLIELLGIQ